MRNGINIEFGFILNALKAKGKKLEFTIFHPDIPDDYGDVMEPFKGEIQVQNHDWNFYLGDTLWAPIENKTGDWRMVIKLDEKIIAEKSFSVLAEHGDGEIQFWKKRGY